VTNGDTATLSAVLDALQGLVRQERLLYLKLQPPPGGGGMSDALTERRFVPSGLDTAPRFTTRVDLQAIGSCRTTGLIANLHG
jgi:hypothetical protein